MCRSPTQRILSARDCIKAKVSHHDVFLFFSRDFLRADDDDHCGGTLRPSRKRLTHLRRFLGFYINNFKAVGNNVWDKYRNWMDWAILRAVCYCCCAWDTLKLIHIHEILNHLARLKYHIWVQEFFFVSNETRIILISLESLCMSI